MSRSIVERLKQFSEKLKADEPIPATRVTVEHTPDGTLTTQTQVVLQNGKIRSADSEQSVDQ